MELVLKKNQKKDPLPQPPKKQVKGTFYLNILTKVTLGQAKTLGSPKDFFFLKFLIMLHSKSLRNQI